MGEWASRLNSPNRDIFLQIIWVVRGDFFFNIWSDDLSHERSKIQKTLLNKHVIKGTCFVSSGMNRLATLCSLFTSRTMYFVQINFFPKSSQKKPDKKPLSWSAVDLPWTFDGFWPAVHGGFVTASLISSSLGSIIYWTSSLRATLNHSNHSRTCLWDTASFT